MAAHIHIGTSGWVYKHWRGLYYPEKLPARQWLLHYAQQFDTTEINGSFYRLPSEQVVQQWAEQVPAGFVFCPKMSRYLTHMKKLNDADEPLERFFRVFAPMYHKMGPVLIQLPPMLHFRPPLAESFYQKLQAYQPFAFVLEIRHPSWMSEESMNLLRNYGVGFVISQSDGQFPYAETITSRHVYLRMHGPAALYASPYTDEMLQYYAGRCREWAEAGYEVWVYFNNDIHGFAPVDALKLKALIEKKQ